MASPSTTPPAAGSFYEKEDDESVASGSSSSSSSDGSSSDDGDDDDDRDDIQQQVVAKITTTQNDKNDEDVDDEDVLKIRLKAFDLINKAGGPSGEDRKKWPQSPQKLHYHHQQQTAGEHSSASYQSPYQQSSAGGTSSGNYPSYHSPSAAHTAEKLSVTELFVNCVSDVCKVSSSELMQQGAALISSGYQSIASYRDKPLNGSYDPIDTSQHGYGNGNGNNPMRGRYRD